MNSGSFVLGRGHTILTSREDSVSPPLLSLWSDSGVQNSSSALSSCLLYQQRYYNWIKGLPQQTDLLAPCSSPHPPTLAPRTKWRTPEYIEFTPFVILPVCTMCATASAMCGCCGRVSAIGISNAVFKIAWRTTYIYVVNRQMHIHKVCCNLQRMDKYWKH
jgi:hypothetical protein